MRCVCSDMAVCHTTVVAMWLDGSERNVAWIRKDCGIGCVMVCIVLVLLFCSPSFVAASMYI